MALTEQDLIEYAQNREDNLAILRKRAAAYIAAYDAHQVAVGSLKPTVDTAKVLEDARRVLVNVGIYEKSNVECALNKASPKRKR